MTTLTLTTNNLDDTFTFTVAVTTINKRKGTSMTVNKICRLQEFDGVYEITCNGSAIKSTCSLADIENSARLQSMTPVVDGGTVDVNGKEYTVKIRGSYSDTGYLMAK